MEFRDLIGEELSILDFNQKMIRLGYYDEYEAYTEELIDSEVIIYLDTKDSETQARVEFKVTIEASTDEDVRATYIKILDIA